MFTKLIGSIFIFLILLLKTSALFSQTEKIRGGFGAVNFGLSTVNVEDLNDDFAQYGYPAFSEKYFTNSLQFGGSIYSVKQNYIFGVEGQGFTSRGIHNAGYNSTITGRIATIDFG